MEAGVAGAKPGIIVWGDPSAHFGEDYRQEYYKGSAEDWGRVVSVNESVSVPAGIFTGCLKTEEWSALEPDVLENRYCCSTVGLLLEVTVRGGAERNELTSLRSAQCAVTVRGARRSVSRAVSAQCAMRSAAHLHDCRSPHRRPPHP